MPGGSRSIDRRPAANRPNSAQWLNKRHRRCAAIDRCPIRAINIMCRELLLTQHVAGPKREQCHDGDSSVICSGPDLNLNRPSPATTNAVNCLKKYDRIFARGGSAGHRNPSRYAPQTQPARDEGTKPETSRSAIRTGFVQDSFAISVANAGAANATLLRPLQPRISPAQPLPISRAAMLMRVLAPQHRDPLDRSPSSPSLSIS